MSSHLAADLAALVDGELDHPSRERVLRHLTRCPDCRAEVTAQRMFKTELRGLTRSAPLPAADLSARLRAVAARPDGEPAAPGGWPGAVWPEARQQLPWAVLPPVPPARVPLSRAPLSRAHLPRSAVGGAVLAFGLGAVLALSGPHRDPVRVPVEPRSDAFLVDVPLTRDLPLPEPTGVFTASLTR